MAIDGAGRTVMPGFINMLGHLHDERAGAPMDTGCVLKLWLACGITTVRDVGGDFETARQLREQSAAEDPRVQGRSSIGPGIRTLNI